MSDDADTPTPTPTLRATRHAPDATAVVLAGGTSRRFGADKLAAELRGTTVLDHLLARLPPEWRVVAVGPRRETVRPVEWTREDPPGGGPLAGVAAGVELVTGDVVAVVAGDMPYAASGLVHLVAALRDQPPDVAGVVASDGAGEANPLLAAYRTAAVRGILPHSAHGRPARSLLALPHVRVALRGSATRDVDTRSDLEDLR